MTSTRPSRQSDADLARAALSGEYEITEEIGRGGMAVVYRAREKGLDRDVAIKVLPPHFTFDESFVERFQREARIAAGLEHPHIVPIYRVGQSGDVIYLVMKLLRGQALSDRLHALGALPAVEVARVLSEVASALDYAARRGVVHRDVKPDNIMLDTDDRCVVTDFGIARSAAESPLTSTGMSVGTPRYMSPEQARAKPLDGRSDIYSLGVVGYECLTGRPPFEADDQMGVLLAHINSPVPIPTLEDADARAVFAVVERMLAKDPRDRFQSAADVVAALTGISGRPMASTRVRMSEGRSSHRPGEVRGNAGGRALSPTRPVAAAMELTQPVRSTHERARGVGQALEAARRVGREVRRQVVGGMARLHPGMRGIAQSTRQQVTAAVRSATWLRNRRLWAGMSLAVGVVTAFWYVVHFATMHRSRCLPINPAALAPSIGRDAPVTILLDAPGRSGAGSELDVYYDVCGFAPGTPYSTKISVTQNGLLNRLAGRSAAVRETYNESASSSAVRRHRTLDTGGLPPGEYTLTLVVTDASDRVRERKATFEIAR